MSALLLRWCMICAGVHDAYDDAGLKRHIELNHKIDQKLVCIGCGEEFYRASLLTEHLEFGKCAKITATQFQGHIVHKYLISELLKGGPALNRLLQKISRYDAAMDTDEGGGVQVDNLIDREEDEDAIREVDFKAIEPEVQKGPLNFPQHPSLFPPSLSTRNTSAIFELSPTLDRMSLGSTSGYATALRTPYGTSSSIRRVNAWGSGKAASTLSTEARPTLATSEFSIEVHDGQMEHKHGVNIMSTRFWDPISEDWNPERFLDTMTQKYSCPFPCEQTFDIPTDLNRHIMEDHRITRMRCPSCFKYFKSCTALMCHCESRDSKCQINKADDYSLFLDKLTGGFLSVAEKTRPEFIHNPSVPVINTETGKMEMYKPPAVSYLQYSVTKPADYKDPTPTVKIGGIPDEHVEPPQKKKTLW